MEKRDDFDDVLKSINGFGLFQKINIAYSFILGTLCIISEISYAMTTSVLKHRCFIPECENSSSSYYQSWLPSMIPRSSMNEYESCLRYNSTGLCGRASGNETFNCDSFIYDTEEWTIMREDWGLNCENNRWMLILVGSLNNAGQFVGGLYVGYLGDRFGRNRVIVLAAMMVTILGTIKSFSVSYPMMVTIEFIEASFAIALFNGSFVLVMELVEPSKRVIAGFLLSNSFPIGEIILASVQWLTLHWRTTLRILYPPFYLTIILLWTMPESVRWLLNKKRSSDAINILRRVAKMNGRTLTEEAENIIIQNFSQKESGEKTKAALTSLFKSIKMRNRFFICIYLWMSIVLVYFGLALNSQSIDNNKFLNFILIAAVEIPATFLVTISLVNVGRKISLIGSMFLCGVTCLLFAFVPEDGHWVWAKLVLYLLGKFGSAAAFFVLRIHTSEIFPTVIRGSVMSWMLTSGKLAAILAPQTPLLAQLYKPLPLLFFSSLIFTAAGLTLTLPETKDVRLPDSMSEAIELGLRKKS